MTPDPSEGRERARQEFEKYVLLNPHVANGLSWRDWREAFEAGRRSLEQERGFVTPDGSASTHPRDSEWAEALNAAGGIQIESFSPIKVINIAAVHKGDS